MPITIRRASLSDYEAIARIFEGPKAASGTLQIPYTSPEAWRRRLETEGAYNLVAWEGHEIVGQLGLMTFANTPRRKHVGAIGMAVRDDWQGKGVGSALLAAAVDLADNWLNLTRVELEVYTTNEAGIHLYKKFGFEMEGTHRNFAFRNGEFVDAYSMARLKPVK